MTRNYTFKDMKRALVVGWGDLGGRVAECWRRFNRDYFGGRLKPLPVFLVPATPYGHWIDQTCYSAAVRSIALACPHQGTVLVADAGTLLHEMIHQRLFEADLCPKHAGRPWCDEVMRSTWDRSDYVQL